MFHDVIETARGPVEYREAGSGAPLLYFHGTGVAGDTMVTVESALVDDGFRLIVPDRPGYGRTPLAPHHSAADCGGVATALLDSLGLSRVAVMGSSGGAAFAASFAINHPDRAQSLVFLCPQLHRWDHKRWLPASSRWTLPLLKRSLLRRILLWLYRRQLPRMSVPQFLKTQAGDRFRDVESNPVAEALCKTTLDAMRRGTRYAGFENDFVIFTEEEIIGPDSSLETPTLIIYDVKDPMAPPDHVDWFVSRFPRCERVSIHAGGHLIWIGPEADLMHQTRVQFLRRHAGRAD